MNEAFIRTAMLLGQQCVEQLKQKKVIIFGIGGVGGHCAEAITRSGVGHICLVDHDEVSVSNINRQIVATTKTIGLKKVDVMKERILEINPECNVTSMPLFYLPENASEFHLEQYDYIVDAIDTITAKIHLAVEAQLLNIQIISSMGAGNKLDPTQFQVANIYETSVCPLAKVMRKELKARNIKNLKVVYSKEEAMTPCFSEEIKEGKRIAPGSCSFVPSVVGLVMAGEVIKDLCKINC